jgi:octaprenyl-diphosphate synthase
MVGGISEDSIKAAALVELLHTATLIHDDVIDEANIRRGGPSVRSVWDNKISIVVGDYIFSSILKNLSDISNLRIIQVLSNITRQVIQGELLQLQYNRNYEIDEDIYLKMISEKTASLLAATCELGAITSLVSDEQNIGALRKFGENIGIAFQIKDDLLDFVGSEITLGKPIANDVLENTITLPLIYGIKNSTNRNHYKILKILKRGVQIDDIGFVKTFAKQSGGIEYAAMKADEFKNKALESLNSFKESIYKSYLVKLADFITTRSH